MRMPWGKYKDTPIDELPETYLWWLYCHPLEADSEEVNRLREAVDEAWHAHVVLVNRHVLRLKRRVFRNRH